MSSTAFPATCLELRSTLNDDGIATLAVRECPVAAPDEMQVVVRVEAAPINPSDLGMLFAGGDAGAALADGDGMFPFVAVPVTPAVLAAQTARLGKPMPVGNEGGGVVVAAGAVARRAGARRKGRRIPVRQRLRAVPHAPRQPGASRWPTAPTPSTPPPRS